jgi:V/A-type H+-transporting ATPase subunit A
MQKYYAEKVSEKWLDGVITAKDILLRGKEAQEQINILGADGVPIEFHERFWNSELIDFVVLQQDAFDSIDCSTSMERQEYMLAKVLDVTNMKFDFKHFVDVQNFFKNIINVFKQMNYSEYQSDKFKNYEKELEGLLNEHVAAEI